ncbi:MAG TPA: MerR family transcriptional regulator [Chloroflexi bacterium]|nr:MerR family transcriptional regulator [Chloroflexota bacterium]
MSSKPLTMHSSSVADGAPTRSFGEQIRARRKELGLSLEDLAQRTGLTASFLSLVERDMSNPSLESLRHIAEALGVPPFYFSQENGGAATMQNPVVRATERIKITFPPGDVTSELLVPNLRHKLEVFISHVKPSAGNIARPPQMDSEECLLVLQGSLRVVLNEQVYELSAGDSIYIQGFALREISALGEEEAVFLSAITPPIF